MQMLPPGGGSPGVKPQCALRSSTAHQGPQEPRGLSKLGGGVLSEGGQSCQSCLTDTSCLWLWGPEMWLSHTEMP